jgi:serine/threonine protein kinase
MCHLHSVQIIHGELNPGNVLLDEDLRPRISGIGFSKELQASVSSIDLGAQGIDSYFYKAPEIPSHCDSQFANPPY